MVAGCAQKSRVHRKFGAHMTHTQAHTVGHTPKCAGFCLVQLLPVNDTRVLGDWRDSYPYSSLCVFALHPIYLSLEAIGAAESGGGGGMQGLLSN